MLYIINNLLIGAMPWFAPNYYQNQSLIIIKDLYTRSRYLTLGWVLTLLALFHGMLVKGPPAQMASISHHHRSLKSYLYYFRVVLKGRFSPVSTPRFSRYLGITGIKGKRFRKSYWMWYVCTIFWYNGDVFKDNHLYMIKICLIYNNLYETLKPGRRGALDMGTHTNPNFIIGLANLCQ